MNPVLIFLLAGLVTYLLRSAMILAGGRVAHGGWFEQHIGYAGPAVLAALIASSLFVSAGRPTLGSAAEVTAVGVALMVVLRTDNVGLALVVGLPVYWLASALGLG